MRKAAILFCLGLALQCNPVGAYSLGYVLSDVATVLDTSAEGDRVILEGKLFADTGKENFYTLVDETGDIIVQIDAARFRLYKAEVGQPIQIFGVYKVVKGADKIIVERLEML